MNKFLLLPAFFLFGCSDFYMSYTSQGHPRIPPPDYWERSDTLGSTSFTMGPQSQVILELELDTSTHASKVELFNSNSMILAWDSLPTDTILILDSTLQQQKTLSLSFRIKYRVTDDEAPDLIQSISLQSAQTWAGSQRVLPAKDSVQYTIPVAAGDSLKLSLDCSPRVCAGTLQNLDGETLWSKQNIRFYRHRFLAKDTLTFLIKNDTESSLIHQDTAVVFRAIPLQ